MELVTTPLLPDGYTVPASRWERPSAVFRRRLETQPYVFAPGIFDPHGAELVMYHGLDAVYFSGYSFAIGHLGTTDMDLYSSVEIADGGRRIVSALRKFQLTMAVGDPDRQEPARHLEIPPVIADMDVGYGNVFNVQRTTELYVNAGLAGAHIEDQVMPKRCGHIAGKALVSADEYVAKLRMMRAVAEDLGHADFVIIARTDGVSAVDAPESKRGLELAIDRALRYLDSGIPDLIWSEFPTADRGATEHFHDQVRRRFPDARFAFNYSSSFRWCDERDPMSFDDLAEQGVRFIFITLAAQHAMGMAFSGLLDGLRSGDQDAYIALQRQEWAGAERVPTRSHHLFTGVPYHHLLGEQLGNSRFGHEVDDGAEAARVV